MGGSMYDDYDDDDYDEWDRIGHKLANDTRVEVWLTEEQVADLTALADRLGGKGAAEAIGLSRLIELSVNSAIRLLAK